MEMKDWTIEKLYQLIANRQLAGVMLHEQAAQYLRFLGLRCIGNLQYNQHREEANGLYETLDYYLTHHKAMLQPKADVYPKVMPTEALSTPAMSVGFEFKRKALANFMDTWLKWEDETATLYMQAFKWCIETGHPDYLYFNQLVKGVGHEQEKLYKLYQKMQCSNWSLVDSEGFAYKLSTSCD